MQKAFMMTYKDSGRTVYIDAATAVFNLEGNGIANAMQRLLDGERFVLEHV